LAVVVISVDWALGALISLAGRLYVRKNEDSEGRAFVAVTSLAGRLYVRKHVGSADRTSMVVYVNFRRGDALRDPRVAAGGDYSYLIKSESASKELTVYFEQQQR
jgi:hypothetical protein